MIGKSADEGPFDPLNYNSFRVQMRSNVNRTRTGATESTVRETNLQAIELYLFTGAWGKYLSTNNKLTFAPGLSPQIENAYIKINVGDAKHFVSARTGIFHPYDGYGASDSPATLSRPFFQSNAANFDQTTFFRTWGFDELGFEVGYDYRRTSVRAALLNGIVINRNREDLFAPFAAQGGPLTRSSPLPGHRGPDYQFFINQALHPEGGGISLHYYRGNVSLPISSNTGSFRNRFDRTAVYGSYPVMKRLNLLAGFQHGRDDTAAGGRFTSQGAFAEAAAPVYKLTAAGARYDWFDPSRDKAQNEVSGLTAYVNAWIYEQVRVVAEYQHRETRRGSAPQRTDDAFQIRFIYIK
jgi:hypothetical protein